MAPSQEKRRKSGSKAKPKDRPALTKKVLIVDDDLNILSFLQIMLSDAGYLVMPVARGEDALQWLRGSSMPDLVLVDIGLPDMNGLDLCKAIRSAPETRKLPVIILTSENKNISKIKAQKCGANLYLNKPIDQESLLDAVVSLIKNSGDILKRGGLLHRKGMEINPDNHMVFYNGKSMKLKGKNLFKLLYLLAAHSPDAMTRRNILSYLGPKQKDNSVNVLISRLKKKLTDAFGIECIETVEDVGYRFF